MPTQETLPVLHDSTSTASLDLFDEALLTGQVGGLVEEDADQASLQIIAQLLAAETDADLQNFGNAESWKDYEGIPMELHGFKWMRSTFDEDGSPAVYVVVSATELESGERKVLTNGSRNVMAQLSNMARRGTLVGSIWQLHRGNPTRAGFRPLWLIQPESIRNAQNETAA